MIASRRTLGLARVLLVQDDVATRLTLQTLLQAGGYCVEVAASAAEAVEKMDTRQYTLVLSDLGLEYPEAGLKVLAHAQTKDYFPATSLIRTYRDSRRPGGAQDPGSLNLSMVVETIGLAALLAKVADLIGLRALRRSTRQLRESLA